MLQRHFYNKYIKDTPAREMIELERGMLCKIKPRLMKIINDHAACPDKYVFLSTKVLKHIYDRHIYDKQSPDDFETILNNLIDIIKRPDELRRNMESKRGDFLCVKKIKGQTYFVSIEVILGGNAEVVSASATGEKYLKKFTLLWSWGTANSPS